MDTLHSFVSVSGINYVLHQNSKSKKWLLRNWKIQTSKLRFCVWRERFPDYWIVLFKKIWKKWKLKNFQVWDIGVRHKRILLKIEYFAYVCIYFRHLHQNSRRKNVFSGKRKSKIQTFVFLYFTKDFPLLNNFVQKDLKKNEASKIVHFGTMARVIRQFC